MHIIIIGAGDVGRELARRLSAKQQEIVVVDRDPQKVKQLSQELDLPVITGNGANLEVLHKANISKARMLIAVTESDEINIIACMLAKTMGMKYTVARIRNPESAGDIDIDTRGLIQAQVGIDVIISPEKAVAQEIAKAIHWPEASEVEYYADGRVMLMAVYLAALAESEQQPLQDFALPAGCSVVGLMKTDGKFILPEADTMLSGGDKVYLAGRVAAVGKAGRMLHGSKTSIKRVIILGGGLIGYTLASILEGEKEHSYTVKIIEKDEKRVDELNRKLGKSIVLQGDGSDISYFNEEEIAEADVLVAATGDDRTNMVASVMGLKRGVAKVISEVTRIGYGPIYEAIGITDTINPHLITASRILKFSRGEDVLVLDLLKDEVAESMELVLPAGAEVLGKNITQAGFPKGLRVAAIVRDDEVIIPDDDITLTAGDHLIIFAVPKVCSRLGSYFVCE
ncbi:Trk system potassium transporter TrkA [Desulfurivibrio alkaliphilus]|uniref:Trk system potassium uptake protein TrkA n=1 Tax=Desulfurivibrio alkaliphilus (strain DSM 19089 / UNIQEM U267 / AHT2) TaxID=589865 RepID=D6Z0Q4_DESAT|nr:Trk system potassium transporter TrkA [Desulfurivibrio alkaliphilus]ADH85283.1 TrkA-N domain protein [Desulfurivibrio alkaliphilus AHT 2]